MIPPNRVNIFDALWQHLDSIAKKCIFGTISADLLQTILYPGSRAQETWDRLKAIFHDTKHTRAIYLEKQFNSSHLFNFSDITSYYKQLKTLRDKIANVDQLMSEQKLGFTWFRSY